MNLNKELNFELFASAISTTFGDLIQNIELLETLGITGIHVDVMDGSFVPRLGMYPEQVRELRSLTSLQIEIHMMIENAESFVNDFVKAGANLIVPHIETLRHPNRTIEFIKSHGIGAGVAINPGTNLSTIEELIPELDLITIMAINPGIIGHRFIENSYSKLQKLNKTLSGLVPKVQIEVDGGITFENARMVLGAGANRLVCGAGTIFHKERSVGENVMKLMQEIEKDL
jgi:ribulose-phosphate 3-epimerase